MKKQLALLIVLIFLVLFSSVSTLFVNLASAYFPGDVVTDEPPLISINSPTNYTTLFANLVTLNCTFTHPDGWGTGGSAKQYLESIGYVLDGKTYGPIVISNDLSTPFNYCTNLILDPGPHTLQVYANANGWDIGVSIIELSVTGSSGIVQFSTLPITPTVVLQPLIINGTSSALNFTLDEPVSKITYSINNHDNVTISGNSTITNLPYGNSNITVYATNPAGNIGVSQTLTFTIAQPFPTFTVITVASTIAVLIVAVGLLVLFRKHKSTAHGIIEGQKT